MAARLTPMTRPLLLALLCFAACNGDGGGSRISDPCAPPDPHSTHEAQWSVSEKASVIASANSPAPASAESPAVPAAGTIESLAVVALSPTLRVDRAAHLVEVDGYISLDAGPLEQICCARGTREHESIFVPLAKPSEIHAALLLAGFEPGAPGSWRVGADGALALVEPRGDEVEVLLRVESPEFRPIATFVRGNRPGVRFPERPFVFAGSAFAPNPPSLGLGEHYVADWTGSIIGLVTFGDEVIAWRTVIPDRVEFAEPMWEANPLTLPAPGTPATLLLRRPASLSR